MINQINIMKMAYSDYLQAVFKPRFQYIRLILIFMLVFSVPVVFGDTDFEIVFFDRTDNDIEANYENTTDTGIEVNIEIITDISIKEIIETGIKESTDTVIETSFEIIADTSVEENIDTVTETSFEIIADIGIEESADTVIETSFEIIADTGMEADIEIISDINIKEIFETGIEESADTVIETSFEIIADIVTEENIEISVEISLENIVDTVTEESADTVTETSFEIIAETGIEESADTVIETSLENIADTSTEENIDTVIETRFEIIADTSVDESIDTVIEIRFEIIADTSVDESIDTDIDISIIDEYDFLQLTAFSGADDLWKFFQENPDSEIAADILITLGIVGKGNRNIIDNLNNYLIGRNLAFKSGAAVDYSLISACILAIMELGSSSSYQALFSAFCAGYPEVIASEAYGAMEIIPGNLHQFLLNALWNNPPDEKFAAFRAGINSERLGVSERGQIAELALDQALSSQENNFDLNMMRYAAVLTLTELRWTRANPLAIRHYYRVQADYNRGVVSKDRLLEAIFCLGAVGNSQAALVLGLQLGLINDRTESTGSFDAEITHAIVQALGLIGDNAAFDQLLYVSNLSYPVYIQDAAMEAIDNLRWGR